MHQVADETKCFDLSNACRESDIPKDCKIRKFKQNLKAEEERLGLAARSEVFQIKKNRACFFFTGLISC